MIFNLKIVARIPTLQINMAHAWNFMSATTLLESRWWNPNEQLIWQGKLMIAFLDFININTTTVKLRLHLAYQNCMIWSVVHDNCNFVSMPFLQFDRKFMNKLFKFWTVHVVFIIQAVTINKSAIDLVQQNLACVVSI